MKLASPLDMIHLIPIFLYPVLISFINLWRLSSWSKNSLQVCSRLLSGLRSPRCHGEPYGNNFFNRTVCEPCETAVCAKAFFLEGLLWIFKCTRPALAYIRRKDGGGQRVQVGNESSRTRLNWPLAIDRHLFLVPLCDLSLGNCRIADEENSRTPGNKRAKNMSLTESSTQDWEIYLIGIALCSYCSIDVLLRTSCCVTTTMSELHNPQDDADRVCIGVFSWGILIDLCGSDPSQETCEAASCCLQLCWFT